MARTRPDASILPPKTKRTILGTADAETECFWSQNREPANGSWSIDPATRMVEQ